MQYLAKCKQSKLNCDEKRSTVSKFSANRLFFTKFLVFFCKKYDLNHPFLQEMLLWNIKFNFGTCSTWSTLQCLKKIIIKKRLKLYRRITNIVLKKKNSPGSVFNKTIIPLALVGYEMIIAKSNAHSWNNC